MKIVVLCGGISTERDVSLISGSMVYKALKKKGHDVIMLDVYLGIEGDVTGIFEKDKDWAAQVKGISEINPDISAVKAMRPDGDRNFFGPNVIKLCQEADVVFMALHGIGGEDGKVQSTFELMGIKYTGTDFTSAAMAMDKAITKDLFKAWGVNTPKGIVIYKKDNVPACACVSGDVYDRYVAENGTEADIVYPCIVKATNGGSSVGVSIANDRSEFDKACDEAFKYDTKAIVEQYIKGREFAVGVIEGKALPVIEIAPKQGFYDYKNKYQAGSTVETCPADLTKEQTETVQKMAERAFAALRYKSYARMDFMLSESGEFYCLECNTLPGMTPTSLLPQEAAAIGISYEDLCEKLIKLAL
ncbi:MAG: D-alanine--D-alanine ligase [Lachnospiraceae bacterium]|jgi:D-alanine-D-alanine ligase|nr:D-alanine--D-alanine ligase [Lachnospiraceae bacterium]